MRLVHFACWVAVISALAVLPVRAEPGLTSANGVTLPTPPIETLDCDRVFDLMHLYSASGYRASGAIPQGPPDSRLFAYENALAKTHYETCHLGQNDFSSPTETFGKGFN